MEKLLRPRPMKNCQAGTLQTPFLSTHTYTRSRSTCSEINAHNNFSKEVRTLRFRVSLLQKLKLPKEDCLEPLEFKRVVLASIVSENLV